MTEVARRNGVTASLVFTWRRLVKELSRGPSRFVDSTWAQSSWIGQ